MESRKNMIAGLGVLALAASLQSAQAGLATDFSTQINVKALQAAAAGMPDAQGEPRFNILPMYGSGAGEAAQYPNVTLDTYARRAYLPNCKGTVELKIAGGNANLIFRDVENCSNFDIMASNGEKVDYPNHKLGGGDRDRSGSFSIPRRLVDYGYNGIIVALQSNSKKTRDLIRIHFWAF